MKTSLKPLSLVLRRTRQSLRTDLRTGATAQLVDAAYLRGPLPDSCTVGSGDCDNKSFGKNPIPPSR